MPAAPRPAYPDAERLPLVDTLHGHAVADPYRWLEDAADPRTEAWSKTQDALFTEARDRPGPARSTCATGSPSWSEPASSRPPCGAVTGSSSCVGAPTRSTRS